MTFRLSKAIVLGLFVGIVGVIGAVIPLGIELE